MRNFHLAMVVSMLATFSMPASTAAFSTLGDHGDTALEKATIGPRWSAEPDPFGRGTGLHDGIQVAVDSQFVQDLGGGEVAELYGVSQERIAELAEQAIRGAFRMWETPVLHFDVQIPGPAVEGPKRGAELDLFAGPSPVAFFGFTDVDDMRADERLLTNGQRVPGFVILGADIFINTSRILDGARMLHQFGLRIELLGAALQILIAHEVGHAIGLDHPNQVAFLDTDTDPYNVIHIDPLDPFAELRISSIPLNTPGRLLPVMWGGLSSANPNDLLLLLARLNDPQLTNDDVGGRDVLYPDPSAATCAGDCSDDGNVTVDEIIVGVSIALGEAPIDECTAFDRNRDSSIQVDELILAIDAALKGCTETARESFRGAGF